MAQEWKFGGGGYTRTYERYTRNVEIGNHGFVKVACTQQKDADAIAKKILFLNELIDALKPFAQYACDSECRCNNCIARDVLINAGVQL